jgi:cellulose synthase/poly-beta-1,6-N-acetylglucosamine synthase-like glycosyltransferase
MSMSGVSVIIASYRRIDQLARCLEGVRAQTRPVEEVLVVVHSSDIGTAEYVTKLEETLPQLRGVVSSRAGSVAAYNAGLAAANQPIVAYVDDDAVPNPDWTELIVRMFERDHRIAAVGGRDIFVDGGALEAPSRRSGRRAGGPPVGQIQRFGRMIANHHLGAGRARDVDVLKGVNMSFRRDAVIGHGFDTRLRGNGAQVHSELSICLPLRRRGLRIIYDPEIVVLHYPAVRPAGRPSGRVRRRARIGRGSQ